MEYRKLVFGNTSKHTILAIDEQLAILAVASENGLIKIYSQTIATLFSVDVGIVSDMQFVKGKGCLIAVSKDKNIHVIVGKGIHDPSVYWLSTATIYVGSSISLVQICQNLADSMISSDMIPLLTVDDNDGIELMMISGSKVLRTVRSVTRVSSTNNHSNHIIRIAETDYEVGQLTVLVLWMDIIQLIRYNCSWSENMDSTLVGSVNFDLDYIICSYANVKEINNLSVISPDSFIVTTSQGVYATLRYNRFDNNLIMEDTVFPYGPFPCKSITKCIPSIISGNNVKCNIFSGGLPAVTYCSLHSLSVAVKDEPEICFTFYDPIINFDIIRHTSGNEDSTTSTFAEILVLTESQLITIVNNGGIWRSSTNFHFSPISRNEVLATSNTIEMDVDDGTLDIQDCLTRFVATFHKDDMIIVWRLYNDTISRHIQLNLGSFLRKDTNESSVRAAQWPRFQKCGLWRNPLRDVELKINSLKLISSDADSFALLLSIDSRVIFHFKILFKVDSDCERIINTLDYQKHISINDNEDSPEIEYLIVEDVGGVPISVELQSMLKFSEPIDLSEIYLHDSIMAFGGFNGVGVTNTVSAKSFYISSEDLTLVDSNQSKTLLSEIILKRYQKRKSFDLSNLRKGSVVKSPKTNRKTKVLNVECLNLFFDANGIYNLLIGYNSGLIMILSFSIDCDGEIIMSSNYRRIASRTKDAVISLCVIGNVNDDILAGLRKAGLEENKTTRSSMDSTKESSFSTGSKSNDGSQLNSGLSRTSSMSRRLSLKWSPVIKKEKFTNDLMLMRCNKNGVKLIDFLKLKTRFKYKIKDQYKKSESLSQKVPTINVIQANIVKGNQLSNSYLVLLCSGGLIVKLSLPNLEPIASCQIIDSITDLPLLSINKDIIVVSQNISVNDDVISAIVVLDERKRMTAKNLIKRQTKYETESALLKIESDQEKIDFMRSAEPSNNFLSW